MILVHCQAYVQQNCAGAELAKLIYAARFWFSACVWCRPTLIECPAEEQQSA